MTTSIRLELPDVTRDAVTFRFTCSPAGPYVRTAFTLNMPAGVDATTLPERLWLTVAMLCLHPQWVVMRPCRVSLPMRLAPGDAERWLRLFDAAATTLDTMRGVPICERSIALVEDAYDPPAPVPLEDIGRCATAFSGGKDSLLQAALLAQLTFRPILVATTSPMAPFHDHLTERRRHVFREIAARRDVVFAEVATDMRSMYLNGWASDERGYPLSISELTDAYLYLANLIVVGAAYGATHLFIASEAEVQENDRVDGRVVQHPHFMYSTATQRGVSALLAPYGIAVSTLTSPLHADSVQRLLWTRYPDLADLQYSCWNTPLDGAACSRCTQCLRIALTAVNAGGDPARMGVDLLTLLPAQQHWQPATAGANDTPAQRVRVEVHAQIVHNLQTIGRARMLHMLGLRRPGRWRDPRRRAALRAYLTLRARARRLPTRTIGWRPGALVDVDPLLRERIGPIYGAAFTAEPESQYGDIVARSVELGTWIAAPLAARAEHILAAADNDETGIAALLPAPDPTVSAADGPVIPVARPSLDGNEARYAEEAVRSGWISSGGAYVQTLEARFGELTGCSHAIACSSGTTALHLALAALGIGAGDEVIVPTFTMIAVANSVAYTGATPIFADSAVENWNVDPAAVAAAITPRTRAIIAVHTYGSPAPMRQLRALADRHGLALVEDAAEAHGARYHGEPVGSLGDIAAFSFYANKIVTTGEGGIVTTNNARLAEVARTLRDHAFSRERHFWHRYRGFNYRMTNVQAAIGVAQLERFDTLVDARITIAHRYNQALRDLPGLVLPREGDDERCVFWMYTLLVEPAFGCSRDELRARLAAAGVETRTTFVPLHLQPIYRASRFGHFPNAERLGATGLYLPTPAAIREDEFTRVVAAVRAAARIPASV